MADIGIGDREADDLPLHVATCRERYRTLFKRLERIERILLMVAGGVGTLLLTVAAGVLIAVISRGLGP